MLFNNNIEHLRKLRETLNNKEEVLEVGVDGSIVLLRRLEVAARFTSREHAEKTLALAGFNKVQLPTYAR